MKYARVVPLDTLTLTTSYQTIGGQIAIAHAGRMGLKIVHDPTASSQILTVTMEVSDDPLDTPEASSVWHPIGAQTNTAGALAQEVWEYAKTSASSDVEYWVPLRYEEVAQKARVRAKCSAALGTVTGSIGIVNH